MAMQWFRFHSEAINDVKLRRVARDSGVSMATALGVWTIILALASESPERGKLLLSVDTPATDEDICDLAGCNVSETLLKLRETGLVTLCNGVMCVPAWDKRQYESDSSTARVQKHRQLKKTGGVTYETIPNETLQKRSGNGDVTPPDNRLQTTDYKDVVVVVADAPNEIGEVFSYWQDNMPGTMTPVISDDLSDLVTTYGSSEVINAITEATRANARNMRYVCGILRKRQNHEVKPAANGNSKFNGGGKVTNLDRTNQAFSQIEEMMAKGNVV